MSLMSMTVREMFASGDDKRDAGLTTPEDVERFDDIVYGADPDWRSWISIARRRLPGRTCR